VLEVLVVMLKLGTVAFGGPAVHVAMLREEPVRRRRSLTDRVPGLFEGDHALDDLTEALL
jgi:hypothetical protein